jgi:hypothetical protein
MYSSSSECFGALASADDVNLAPSIDTADDWRMHSSVTNFTNTCTACRPREGTSLSHDEQRATHEYRNGTHNAEDDPKPQYPKLPAAFKTHPKRNTETCHARHSWWRCGAPWKQAAVHINTSSRQHASATVRGCSLNIQIIQKRAAAAIKRKPLLCSPR